MAESMNNNEVFFEAMLKQAVIQDCLRELESLPSEEELDKTLSYSPRHVARMKKLFAAEARREFMHRFITVAKKTAAAIAIAVGILFGLLMLNKDVRAAVVDTIVEWFETFTRFQSPQGEDVVFDTSWRPSYVPEGFVETDVFEDAESEIATILYRSESERINLTYMSTINSLSIDNEDFHYEEKEIDGVHYFLFEGVSGGKENSLIWETEGIRFSLISTLSLDELQVIAQSVSRI